MSENNNYTGSNWSVEDENGVKVWTKSDMVECKQKDNVNHPSHYTNNGGIECIEAIRASMDDYMYEGYLKANIIKYIWRYDKKNGTEDLKKAQVYLNWLIELKEND